MRNEKEPVWLWRGESKNSAQKRLLLHIGVVEGNSYLREPHHWSTWERDHKSERSREDHEWKHPSTWCSILALYWRYSQSPVDSPEEKKGWNGVITPIFKVDDSSLRMRNIPSNPQGLFCLQPLLLPHFTSYSGFRSECEWDSRMARSGW